MPARPRLPPPTRIPAEEARAWLVGHHGLDRSHLPHGLEGVRALLKQLRCIQLDPLDVMGTNADLVALARVDGIRRGDVFSHVYPGHAFEHFAKERCLLPSSSFPWYRDRAAQASWWRHSERIKRLPAGVIDAVLAEIHERGPLAAEELSDHGRVRPLDWSGWTGTGRAALMAVEVLWTRCQVVVAGRTARGKLYDIPGRALGEHAARPAAAGGFHRWGILERVHAAGLLARASGPTWCMLEDARTTALPDQLVAEGLLEEVIVEGRARPYLAPAGFRARSFAPPDDRMRILGPLDPMLWDRALVRQVFGFEYVWEVYKPEAQRRWGWYVCPLLHRGQLVGRVEAVIERDALRVKKVWRERSARLDEAALAEALNRHARACGVDRVRMPRRVLIST
jgi:uncharacterized protein YcaQ